MNHASATHSPPSTNAATTARTVFLIAEAAKPSELVRGYEGARGRERRPIGIDVGKRDQLLIIGLSGRLVARRRRGLGGADEAVEAVSLLRPRGLERRQRLRAMGA